jgi:hypothetical protein
MEYLPPSQTRRNILNVNQNDHTHFECTIQPQKLLNDHHTVPTDCTPDRHTLDFFYIYMYSLCKLLVLTGRLTIIKSYGVSTTFPEGTF